VTLNVIPLDTPSLGERSYIVHDGTTAAVIDPQRDVDRVTELVTRLGLRIGAVAETHMHNDYISGGLALAQAHGAEYLVSADDPVAFARLPVHDGEEIAVGSFALRARHTPGHTFTHLSYVLLAAGSAPEPRGVFTGGSLLHGSTGRPDLLGPAHSATLAGLQYASARALVAGLPDDTPIYPTHGFGSFCAATATSGDQSTIADERRVNPALLTTPEEFISATLAGLDAFPRYYRYMGPANLAGPPPADLSALTTLTVEELRAALARGDWVIDVRPRDLWAAGHIPRSVSFGLDGAFATYLGWVFPYEERMVLIGAHADQITAAQRELVRIGIDRPAGALTGPLADATASTPRATFADVVAALADPSAVVLDVRREGERRASHIVGSHHIPFHELPQRAGELPAAATVWVHCASAYRAAAACGLLERAGLTTVLVDEAYEECLDVAGLSVTTGAGDAGPVAASDLGALAAGSGS